MKNKKPHYAWIILLGVILIRGFAGGGINSVSGLFLYPVSRDIGVGIGTLSIYLSITSIVMVLWLPLAGRLINRYDVRLVAAAGAVLQALSFMSFGLMNSVYGWYLMAVPYAMGSTILVSLLGPILINRWFAGNTGMMLGLQMAFVGLFGSGFSACCLKNNIRSRLARRVFICRGRYADCRSSFFRSPFCETGPRINPRLLTGPGHRLTGAQAGRNLI